MKESPIRFMTQTALCAALIAIVAPISVPVGPVPISLATLMVYLCASVLGWKKSCLGVALYILLGVAGLPVFAGYTAGLDKLLGPTGGYFLGYLIIALSTGFFVERFGNRPVWNVAGMVAGTAACYLAGTLWLAYVGGYTSFGAALAAGVLPFLIGDVVKIAASASVGYVLRRRLMRTGMVQ